MSEGERPFSHGIGSTTTLSSDEGRWKTYWEVAVEDWEERSQNESWISFLEEEKLQRRPTRSLIVYTEGGSRR